LSEGLGFVALLCGLSFPLLYEPRVEQAEIRVLKVVRRNQVIINLDQLGVISKPTVPNNILVPAEALVLFQTSQEKKGVSLRRS